MAPSRPILRVGLTGGIASGKTTVAHLLAEFGAFIVDGDEVAHEVLEPRGKAYDRVVRRFGRGILDDDGRIARKRLALQVFHDEQARNHLNAIVHPVIRAEVDRRIDEYAPHGHSLIAVFDAALLVESGFHRTFARLIVVRCRRETQIRRLLARDGLETEEAEVRIDAQAPLEQKLALADYVVDTEGTMRELRKQVESVYLALVEDFKREFDAPID